MEGIFLFQFNHRLDMEAVQKGGPWSYDSHLLILEKVQVGVQIEYIPLFMWISRYKSIIYRLGSCLRWLGRQWQILLEMF